MKKIKLYLDSSVIGALDDNEMPDRMQETHRLWNDIIKRKYDVVFSEVLFDELVECCQTKKDILTNFIKQIKFKYMETNEMILNITKEIIKMGILTENSYRDCLHIATALYSDCDIIISWNMKHLVKPKTIKGVRTLTDILHYKKIDIVTPKSMNIKETK